MIHLLSFFVYFVPFLLIFLFLCGIILPIAVWWIKFTLKLFGITDDL